MQSLSRSLAITIVIAASYTAAFHKSNHLATFVSNPEIRAPIINITRNDLSRTTRGSWFVAPYGNLLQRHEDKLYLPAQTGPHIYSDDGTLIWSGAQLYHSRSLCDFRLSTYRGEPTLSFIVGETANRELQHAEGAGILLDHTYTPIREISTTLKGTKLDIHELLIDGETATFIYNVLTNPTESVEEMNWNDGGFLELDMPSGEILFDWEASRHIDRYSTTFSQPMKKKHAMWDWFHMNSVERTPSGDFIVSARHTDAIYKISRQNGSVLWQLGGARSTFTMQGFNFYRQHNARVIGENATTTIISLLDNGADPLGTYSPTTSAMLISLSHQTHQAHLLQQWHRPDGEWSRLRGNVQILPDSNIFIGWSGDDGYMSEHTADGDVVMEARFVSDRLSTYRAYKYFNFTGMPADPPVLKARGFETAQSAATTVFYVSWNGATEVSVWRFYTSEVTGGPFQLIGNVSKSGFETVFAHSGSVRFAFAEAVDSHGMSLRNSSVYEVEIEYRAAGSQEDGYVSILRDQIQLQKRGIIDPRRQSTFSLSGWMGLLIAFSLGYISRRFHRGMRRRCSGTFGQLRGSSSGESPSMVV